MKINFTPQKINFGAIDLGTKYVNKLNQENEYEPSIVHFVEIDDKNKNDVKALENISKYWRNCWYAEDIYNTALEKYDGNSLYKNYKVYALTSQQNNFECLGDDKILGVVEVYGLSKNNSTICIGHIESKPNDINLGEKEYKGIGSAMLKSLQDIFNRIDVVPRDSEGVKNFYRKNGFDEYPAKTNHFVWIKNIF